MAKHKSNIKIPKGTKCADGTICERDIEVENVDIDIPETNPSVEIQPTPTIQIPNSNQQLQQIQVPPAPPPNPTPEPEEKSFSTDELADLMPTGVNFATCKGKNCDDSVIKNKKFTTKFKQCPKCGCNNVPMSSNMCPCCGKSPNEDEEDYWEESDIDIMRDSDEDDE